VDFVLGIDVDARKVGLELADAIFAAPNNTTVFHPDVTHRRQGHSRARPRWCSAAHDGRGTTWLQCGRGAGCHPGRDRESASGIGRANPAELPSSWITAGD